MQIATSVVFVLLCVSAPWVSRRWGLRGGLAWGLAVLVFVITSILALD